jgi:hypothetical protein
MYFFFFFAPLLDGRAQEGGAKAASGVFNRTLSKGMRLDEARGILNVEKETPIEDIGKVRI